MATGDWGEFFSRLGSGLGVYATYATRERDRDEERKYRASELALREAERGDTEKYRAATLASAERTRLDEAERHRVDHLYDEGIEPPADYGRNARAAALPETPGYDTGGMAINAVRQAGQARTNEFDNSASQAQNELYHSKDLSRPLPGGGRVFVPPGVRANLDVLAGNEDIAAKNRAAAIQAALIRARSVGSKTDQVEKQRVDFMTKYVSDAMKPPVDPITGLPTGKAKTQAEAYREGKALYEQIKGNLNVPGRTNDADSLPSDNFTGDEDKDFDPMAVANELKGLDPDTAREVLVSQGYTPKEIRLVLGE